MKKLILVVCALFFVSSIQAQVWLPMSIDFLNLESFRHQATQVIEDDLDNGIDGTDIFAVEGARIYTNLSNLATGTEEQGDNSASANTVVIGATSPIYKNYKVTVFYGNTNDNETSMEENIMNNEWDSDADDVLDRLSSGYSISSYGFYSPANTMLINIGKQLGKGTEVAFTYKRSSGEYKNEYEDSLYATTFNLNNDDVLELEEGFGNENLTSSAAASLYSLSYSKPYRNWDLRGDVFLIMGSEKMNGDGFEYSFVDNDPANLLTTETDLDSIIGTDKDEYKANLAGVTLELSDENAYGVLWEVSGSYGMVFGSGDYQEISHERTVQNFMIGTDVAEINSLGIYSETAPISVSGSAMGINGRIEWQISENVRFGAGLMANSFSLNLEYDLDETDMNVYEYNDGDGVGEVTDYVTTNVTGSNRLYTLKNKANSIVIPAGVEVNFGKNKDWFIRLGAMSTGLNMEQTYITDYTSVGRDSTTTENGDGSSSSSVTGNINYTDSENKSSTTYQNVNYVYGLGWKPSKNLSLDFVGMFDLPGAELLSTDWLRSLKLSATINVQ